MRNCSTTQRYMHLSPAAIEARFGCWSRRRIPFSHGNIVATANEA